jgi:hypothetical protein
VHGCDAGKTGEISPRVGVAESAVVQILMKILGISIGMSL